MQEPVSLEGKNIQRKTTAELAEIGVYCSQRLNRSVILTTTTLTGGVRIVRLSRPVGKIMCGRWCLTVIRRLLGMVISAGR